MNITKEKSAKNRKFWPIVKILNWQNSSFTLFLATVGQKDPKIVGKFIKFSSKIHEKNMHYGPISQKVGYRIFSNNNMPF
jgi:hypothetical protein